MIIPTGHRVLVKADDVDLQTDWGFHIVADERREKHAQNYGTVLAVGPDAWKAFRKMSEGKEVNGQPWAAPGDRIVYAKYAGKFLNDPETGDEVIIINDEDVVAIVHEESKDE